VLEPGSTRQRLERKLNAAYAEGVLSQNTLVHRLEQLFGGPLVDPARLVGDLKARKNRRFPASVGEQIRAVGRKILLPPGLSTNGSPVLLALDWNGGPDELVIGRNPVCDIVLPGPAVSRRHARLTFRDGTWILQDLDSTNGTVVNGALVGRCKLEPGDRVIIGDEQLIVD
jgi:FHA domain